MTVTPQTPPEHATTVKARRHSGRWLVICRSCGRVGPPHYLRHQALIAATTHTERNQTGGNK